jgi:hypothetical protein
MPAAPYLTTIERLAALEPAVFVFGGFAEDAVLDRSITRPHGDVDVLVGRETLDVTLAQLESLGFRDFRVLFEPEPARPLVLGAGDSGQSLELGVFDELEPRIASFVLPAQSGLTRITLPDDTLRHPIGSIEGVPIRTVSPLALYQLREAFIQTGVFGPPRDKDRAAQDRLRRELLDDVSDGDLMPRMRAA